MVRWSEKLHDSTPSNFTITGPDCCRLLQQLPQGYSSNLVYNSLSIHSCNLAQVITTSLPPTKSSPNVLSQKSAFKLRCFAFFGRWLKQIQCQCAHAFLGQAYVRSPGVGDPAQSAHPEHISHTNTHLSHRSNPLHHSHGWSLSLNVPPRLERTNKSSDLPLICSLASAWATINPAHQGQALHRGVSISTAFCFYHSAIGTGQSDALQLEMETWGLCPWRVPAAPQKKCEHTFLI